MGGGEVGGRKLETLQTGKRVRSFAFLAGARLYTSSRRDKTQFQSDETEVPDSLAVSKAD